NLWRCGIVSIVFILATAIGCLAVPEEQPASSFKLVQTLNKAELASTAPFNQQGLLAVRVGDVVQLWDTRTSQLKVSLVGLGKILKTSFSSDGATFITSSREKSAGLVTKLWDAQTGQLKISVSGLIVYGPAAGEIVTLTDHEDLKFWKAGTGRLIAELKPPQNRYIPYYMDLKLWGATFSPDSRIVATEDSISNIQLWDTSTGRLRALLEGHVSTVYTLAFSSDGRLLAIASRDGTARIWDVETGRLLVTLP